MNSDINGAVRDAEDAFWAKVAEAFPDVKTGDFPPDASHDITKAMRRAVLVWLAINRGGSDEQD